MALQHYNHTAKLYLAQEVDLTNLKAMLLNDDAVFNAADETIEDVAGVANVNEVAGNGWAAGGEVLAVDVITASTNHGIVDAADVSKTATGGDIGPTYKVVILDATNDLVLHFDTFASPRTANEGVDFLLVIPSTGLFRIRPPS